MSALLAALGPSSGAVADEGSARNMLHAMAWRGSEHSEVWRGKGALLAVARDGWEMEEEVAGAALVSARGPCRVVSDASIYYRADLARRLRSAGVPPASEAASDLIAAAWLAFGPRCVDHLEGDFAFCVWDARTGALFCARDPFGTRGLYWTEWNGTFWVASTTLALASVRGEAAGFDPVGIARALLLRPGDGTLTPWAGIRDLPAAHTLTIGPNVARTDRYWSAEGAEEWARLDADEAVDAAAHLLREACRERHIHDGSAIALSGGKDSTAVLASLVDEPGASPDADLLSIDLPGGDDSWYVTLVAETHGVPVHWVEIDDLGFFDDAERRALTMSHCTGHIFEGHNRRIAHDALGLADRVLLNGHGGDNLFAVGDWALADLLRAGRWAHLRSYFRARGYRGLRQLLTHAVRPALPPEVFDHLEPFLRRRICSRPWERPVPPWITAPPDMMDGITEADRRDHHDTIVRRYDGVADRHRAWALMDSTFQRQCTSLFDVTRDEGVELRMPFYDRRLVQFVMSRPVDDFNQPRRYKVLLDEAMKGRLPPRDRKPQKGGLKPGSAIGLLELRWPTDSAAVLERLRREGWRSEALGLVDVETFERLLDREDADLRSMVVDGATTLFAEAWLRAHGRSRPLGTGRRAAPGTGPRAMAHLS